MSLAEIYSSVHERLRRKIPRAEMISENVSVCVCVCVHVYMCMYDHC
jgi:hypothetical protein